MQKERSIQCDINVVVLWKCWRQTWLWVDRTLKAQWSNSLKPLSWGKSAVSLVWSSWELAAKEWTPNRAVKEHAVHRNYWWTATLIAHSWSAPRLDSDGSKPRFKVNDLAKKSITKCLSYCRPRSRTLVVAVSFQHKCRGNLVMRRKPQGSW